MIEGINIRCNIGPFEVLRSPRINLVYRRAAVVSRAEITVSDPGAEIGGSLQTGMAVQLRFGYRGEANLWHEWQGTVAGLEQSGPDALSVAAVGREQALLDTKITRSFHGEPAALVARRVLEATGLPVGEINIPADILPHIVFSNVSAARAIKQLEQSLARSFGHDFSRHSVWLSADGQLTWSDADEPGDTYVFETAQNLFVHSPAHSPAALSEITACPAPGLIAGMRVRIRDARRGVNELVRALEVRHELGAGGNKTIVLYGTERGWG